MLGFLLSQPQIHCQGIHCNMNKSYHLFIFPCGISTSALPKATLHHEGNLRHASFPSIVKANQHMVAHLIAHAPLHFQKQH